MTERMKSKIQHFEAAMRPQDEPAGLNPARRRYIMRNAASKLLSPEKCRELLDRRRGNLHAGSI